MQTSTYPRGSEHSDNIAMRHLTHRSAIACKLGTAIVLLLHSMFGCTWAHGCCSNHRPASTVGSQAHSSCQHARTAAPQKTQVNHPACEHQHDDHQTPRSDRVEHESCDDHARPSAVNALTKQNAQRLPGRTRSMQPSGISHSVVSHLVRDEFPNFPAAFIQGRFQETWQANPCTTAPLRQPCSDHSDPCCSSLHCSFLTETAETLSIELGSLFPQAQVPFALSVQKTGNTAFISRPRELMCVPSQQPHCALLCVWQV